MTSPENLFILLSFLALCVLAVCIKNIPWHKLGFKPKPWWGGVVLISIFSLLVFILVQSSIQFFQLPAWVTDKDPILKLLIIVILQELIFRGLFITWLERLGKQKALWISTIVFAATHLFLPSPWLLTGLSLIAGYFWGWHFLKYRNIYLIVISHLIVNLSFNYLIF